MTRIVRTEVSDLPQLTAAAAVVLAQAARLVAAGPARLELPLGELGDVEVTCEGVVPLIGEKTADATGDVVLGLTRASGAGRLVVDGALARGLVAAALGTSVRATAPLARIGLAERGIVAGIVAGALSAARAPFSVSLVAPSSTAIVAGVGVAWAVRSTVGAGWVRLEIPGSWVDVEAQRARVAHGALEIEARVEVARTRLLAPDLARVEVGDAIVFDGEPADPHVSGRAVRITLGTAWIRARVIEDDAVLIEEAWHAGLAVGAMIDASGETRNEEATGTMRDPGESRESTAGASPRPADLAEVLANVPVEIVAELGRVSLRADEAAALAPGAVLRFGRAGVGSVSLLVGDQVWAEGELVAVDGDLGVRVTATRGRGLR